MPSSPPLFMQADSTDLYWLDSSRTVGFLAGTGSSTDPSLTLPETWADPAGVYVFLGSAPAAADEFAKDLQSYVASAKPSRPRFVWIVDPNAGVPQWTVEGLATSAAGDTTVVARAKELSLANWSVVVRAGAVVTVAEGAAGWGFQLADPKVAPAIGLIGPDGVFGASAGSSSLPMTAESAGCLAFTLEAPAAADGPDVFARLSCAIRYGSRDPATGIVQSTVFPVLVQPAATGVTLVATIDPLRPTDDTRTCFAFSASVSFHSGFVTVTGHGVDLAPVLGATSRASRPRLVFGTAPVYAGDEKGDGPSELYTCPAGPFSVTAANGGAPADGWRVLCGAAGVEYLSFPAATGSMLTFVPGRPAFASFAGGSGNQAALTGSGTTSWVWPRPPAGHEVGYCSQPSSQPFFHRTADDDDGGSLELLDFLEIAVAQVGPDDAARPFPMTPFAHLDPDDLHGALALERAFLGPRRAAALLPAPSLTVAIPTPTPPTPTPPTPTPPTPTPPTPTPPTVAVTPVGTAAGVTGGAAPWAWLALGQNAVKATQPDLVFTSVGGRFRQAMLTKDLFMVLGNADEFAKSGSSVQYQLDAGDLTLIRQLPDGGGVRAAVLTAVETDFGGTFPLCGTLDAFRTSLTGACADMTDDEMYVFQRYAGKLSPEIAEWSFQLSPEHWTYPRRKPSSTPPPEARPNTYLVYKLGSGRTLVDLLADQAAWTWPEAASPDGPKQAERDIRAIVAKAVEHAGTPAGGTRSPYANFVAITHDPEWTGILALSVDVPLDRLPDQLQVLAGGIDVDEFYAHHVGLTITPFEVDDDEIAFKRSTWFGLLDYEDEEDQHYSETIPFAFKVSKLTVGFENSAVTTFSSRVQLLVNRLFGVPTRLLPTDRGNNVILEGSYQKQTLPDGTQHDAYLFGMRGFDDFQLGSAVVDRVQLLSTDLVASKTADPVGGNESVEATFQMTGNLRFYEPPGFDPFCWGNGTDFDGYLRFGGLAVVMTFDLGNPDGTRKFELRDGNLSFDLANSKARPDSLVSRFPVQLAGLVTTPDPGPAPVDEVAVQTPGDMGYVSISAPLQQSEMKKAPWYGLHYTVDLGTLGSLAAGTGLSLDVLAAWRGGASETPEVYLGVKLPGAKDVVGVSLPLEGLLNIGFRSIGFVVGTDAGGRRTYALVARDFAVRFLGLSFPPGRNELLLFGNPDQASDTKTGWYAAYVADKEKKKDELAAPGPRAVTRRSPAPELR